jgi:hypothetical protein
MASQHLPILSMATREDQFHILVTSPPGSSDGKQILDQIPVHPPVAHLGQHSSTTSSHQPRTNFESFFTNGHVSLSCVDVDSHQDFSPPSRPPTQDGNLDGARGASTPINPKLEQLARASTAPSGRATSNTSVGPVLEKAKLPGENTNLQPKRTSDLGDSISRAMRKGKEIGLDGTKAHLSAETLSTLVTIESIRKSLPLASNTLIEFINKNKELFAITLLVVSDREKRLKAMQNFLEHEFDNDCLPVESITKNGVCRYYEEESECETVKSGDSQPCRHNHKANAFHDDTIWNWTHTDAFYEKQWNFLVPKFHENRFEYHLHDPDILPVHDVVMENDGDEGHFSIVYKAMMLAHYQDAIQTVR